MKAFSILAAAAIVLAGCAPKASDEQTAEAQKPALPPGAAPAGGGNGSGITPVGPNVGGITPVTGDVTGGASGGGVGIAAKDQARRAAGMAGGSTAQPQGQGEDTGD